jgi:hypothetical protein
MAMECRIKCEFSPGIFSDEVVARMKALGSDMKVGTITVFVSKDVVSFKRHNRARGTLRAYCTEIRKKFAAVVLPQTSLENGQSVIVPSSQVICRRARQ